jgi:predicted metal-dependent enzyme (double-stranded beta helix superfamily)
MSFDPERFVADCFAAALESRSELAVRDVVMDAIRAGSWIDRALGTDSPAGGPVTLIASERLTIQRFQWPGGYRCCPHEHRMWAVVGVYAGREINRCYDRTTTGLREREVIEVRSGEIIVMDADVVHTVENPAADRTAALHVYGGDLLSVARHGWDPSGLESPYDEVAAGERLGFIAIAGIEADRATEIDPESRYRALHDLVAAREQYRRFLTLEEARAVVQRAWPFR